MFTKFINKNMPSTMFDDTNPGVAINSVARKTIRPNAQPSIAQAVDNMREINEQEGPLVQGRDSSARPSDQKNDHNKKYFYQNDDDRTQPEQSEKPRSWHDIAKWLLVAFAILLITHFILTFIDFRAAAVGVVTLYRQLDPNFHWMLLAGFLAQLVDGALGMGYGLTSATILLSTGVSPAAISGSIHTAEVFASGASGYSHFKFGNVNKKMFRTLVIPGVVGAILGAVLLVFLGEQNAEYLRPVLATYTMFLGIKMITNAFRDPKKSKKFRKFRLLAGVGGFLDSFGGGGWGPLVTSTLISKGRTPRFVIGTVSLTEFFVTLASAFSFFLMLGVTHWQVIVALMVGGLAAAPLAALLVGKIPKKTAFLLIGMLVIAWSCRILMKLL
jgi:uncharacterized membrane protein YfcA